MWSSKCQSAGDTDWRPGDAYFSAARHYTHPQGAIPCMPGERKCAASHECGGERPVVTCIEGTWSKQRLDVRPEARKRVLRDRERHCGWRWLLSCVAPLAAGPPPPSPPPSNHWRQRARLRRAMSSPSTNVGTPSHARTPPALTNADPRSWRSEKLPWKKERAPTARGRRR